MSLSAKRISFALFCKRKSFNCNLFHIKLECQPYCCSENLVHLQFLFYSVLLKKSPQPFLQEYLTSEGIELNDPEIPEQDPYAETRKQPLRSYKTPSDFDKLKQFLELDRKVLRFYCVWDDRDSMFGEIRPCVSNLCSDTAENKHLIKMKNIFPCHLLAGWLSVNCWLIVC